MKIPKEIVGRRKIRDLGIISTWVRWHENELADEEPVGELKKRICVKYRITESYIYQILRKNKVYLKPDIDWEKNKIRWRLDREIAKKPSSTKDVADLMEQKRKLIEGDKPIIDQSQHTHFTFEYGRVDEDKVRATQRPNESLAEPSKVESIGGRQEIRENLTSDSRTTEESNK